MVDNYVGTEVRYYDSFYCSITALFCCQKDRAPTINFITNKASLASMILSNIVFDTNENSTFKGADPFSKKPDKRQTCLPSLKHQVSFFNALFALAINAS